MAVIALLSPAALAAQPTQALTQTGALRRFRWSRQAQQDKDGFYYQPAGLCEDYPQEARTEAKLHQDFEVIRQVGAKMLRFGISWYEVEPRQGQYDWDFWDRLVATAAHYHVALIPYVCYTPEWAAQDRSEFWRQPPKDMRLFGEFMYEIALRYKGKIHSWELWNEPDNPDYWFGTAAQYAQLVMAGAQGVRRADPEAIVVLGGLSFGPGRFFEQLKTEDKIEGYIDAVNIHGYAETWSPDRVERYSDQIDTMANAIREPNSSPDLWMAEFGYSDFRYSPSQVSKGGVPVYYSYEHTADYQAVELFRSHILALATGDLAVTAWYRINDLKPATAVIGDDNNLHLGIVDLQHRPKPAFYALRFYNRLFDQPTRSIDSKVEVQTPARSQSVIHVFQKRNGDIIVIGWLRSSKPGEVTVASGMAVDSRRETVTVTLPDPSPGRFVVYDINGCPIRSEARRTGSTISNVVLTGDRIFIAELRH